MTACQKYLLVVSIFVANCVTAYASDCTFAKWTSFKGTDIKRNADKTAYLYVTGHSRVDADGAPNAYHPSDVGKGCLTRPYYGLDCPGNAGYPNTTWWDSVLVPDPDDPSKPFVQTEGEFQGYFVSSTWLFDANKTKTDPAKYVDASKTPYLVFPGSKFANISGTGSKGDVGMVWNLENGKSTAFIVADQGGGANAKLGEGSVALYEALGGTNVDARTGRGVAQGKMLFAVFPGSRKAIATVWPRNNVEIFAQAEKLVNENGGYDAFNACK